MTDKQPEALIRADELEQIGAESSLARAMAAHTIRLLYKENEALRARLAEPEPEVRWDASAPLVVHPHPAFQATQPDLAKVGEVGVWGERQWQGLTDEECLQNPYCAGENDAEVIQLARAIEAKLKEKNNG